MRYILSFLFVFISIAVLQAQQLSGDSIIKRGVRLYDEKNYAEAIAQYNQVSKSDSSYNKMLAEMAMTYLAMEKYDSAIIVSDQGLSLVGDHHRHLLRTKGTAYDYLGESEKAIEIYSKAVEAYPHNYLLNYNLGISYLGAKKYALSQACFQEALRCNPYHASSHMQLGQLALRQKQYTKAMLSLETFLAMEPTSDRSNKILVLVENLSNNYIDTAKISFIDPVENNTLFEEVDHYIKARIVLSDRYTLPIEFNASLVKQTKMLLDVLPFGEKEGFWTQLYFPFFEAIKEGEHLEPFLYTILRSANNDLIDKYISKSEKELGDFYAVGSKLSIIKRNRPTNVTGDLMNFDFGYYDNGALFSIGNYNPQGVEEGEWRFYHSNGELSAIGIFKEGKKSGEWLYYNTSGQVIN